jgi:membrane-bound lytic murein transglycosylase D
MQPTATPDPTTAERGLILGTRTAVALALAVGAWAAQAQAPVVTLTPTPVEQTVAQGDAPAASTADGDAAAIDPVRPDVRIDLDDRAARTDLWQRIRSGFAIPDIDDRYVRQRERYYGSQPEYVGRMTDRGSRYLFHIVEEVQRRGLPTELALLPFIESAFNPEAVSRARAAGMWQFMPATGVPFDR